MATNLLAASRIEKPELSSPGERRLAYVHPGHVFVSPEPVEAMTVLGSCVAVCLWDARLRLGGINHFLLPESGSADSSARFGRGAIVRLIDELGYLGSRKTDLSAKLFGGAAVIEAFRSGVHLGTRNVEVARQVLEEYGIPIVAEDVLGSRGRKLIFHTGSGVALIRLI